MSKDSIDGLLPSFGEVNYSFDGQTRQLDLTTEKGERIFDVLSANTTRQLLFLLYETPKTPTELADELETSLQNVHYHLDKLETVELIEVADTGYSEKGNEIEVFSPSQEGVVFYFGAESYTSRIKDTLSRFVSTILLLLAGAIAVWQMKVSQHQPTRVRADSPALDPVVMFLLGGLLILIVSILWIAPLNRLT